MLQVYLPMCYLYCSRFANPKKDTDATLIALRNEVFYYSVYLLYWYKSTNTYSPKETDATLIALRNEFFYYSVYLLYWYKSTYTDAKCIHVTCAALRLELQGDQVGQPPALYLPPRRVLTRYEPSGIASH